MTYDYSMLVVAANLMLATASAQPPTETRSLEAVVPTQGKSEATLRAWERVRPRAGFSSAKTPERLDR